MKNSNDTIGNRNRDLPVKNKQYPQLMSTLFTFLCKGKGKAIPLQA